MSDGGFEIDDLVRRPGGARFRLGPLMVVIGVIAVLFWAGREASETNDATLRLLIGVGVGAMLAVLGFWAAMRMVRFAFLGWIVFVVGYAIMTALTLGGIAVLTYPILISAIIYLNLRRRSNDQEAMLGILDLAARARMPLGPAALAHADESSGMAGVWAATLAERLDLGQSLPEAVESLPRLLPREAPILIRAGSEAGDPAAGLAEAVRARSAKAATDLGSGFRIGYLCWVLVIGQSIIGFMSYFILPKFGAIYYDFGMKLPAVTEFVMGSGQAIVLYGWAAVLAEFVLLMRVFFGVIGPGSLGIPVVDRVSPRFHSLLIFRALAIAVEAGRPIGPALDSLAEHYPARWIRRRLKLAASDVRDGAGWARSLRASGLLRRGDEALIGAAERAGNLGWALRELADSGERRRGYRLQVWSTLLFTLAILMFGAITLLYCVAYFVPLIELVRG